MVLINSYLNWPFDALRGLEEVLEKTGSHRTIMHLSAPHDGSVNDDITKDCFSLPYTNIDDAELQTNYKCTGPSSLSWWLFFSRPPATNPCVSSTARQIAGVLSVLADLNVLMTKFFVLPPRSPCLVFSWTWSVVKCVSLKTYSLTCVKTSRCG